jgi:hypothetical protein
MNLITPAIEPELHAYLGGILNRQESPSLSIGKSNVEMVKRYTARGKEHHRTRSFESELPTLLRKYEVEYDEPVRGSGALRAPRPTAIVCHAFGVESVIRGRCFAHGLRGFAGFATLTRFADSAFP